MTQRLDLITVGARRMYRNWQNELLESARLRRANHKLKAILVVALIYAALLSVAAVTIWGSR